MGKTRHRCWLRHRDVFPRFHDSLPDVSQSSGSGAFWRNALADPDAGLCKAVCLAANAVA